MKAGVGAQASNTPPTNPPEIVITLKGAGPPPPDFEPVYIDEFNGTPTLAVVAAVSSSAAASAACGGL